MISRIPRIATIGLLLASLAICPASSAAERKHRLPPGAKWGRCLLIVGEQTRIKGDCSYQIDKGGNFHIDGPNQVFGGIDYPKAEIMADARSEDYWADIFKDESSHKKSWTGYGNEYISAVHAEYDWGHLTRNGACYTGIESITKRHVRICLWKH